MAARRDIVLGVKLKPQQASGEAKKLSNNFKNVGRNVSLVNTRLGTMVGKLKRAASSFISIKGLVAGIIVGKVIQGFQRIGGALMDTIKLYGVQQEAEMKLANALKTTGNNTKAVTDDLKQYASELQSVTTYGDETILSMQAMFATFKMTPAEIKRATVATLDMASAMKMDLKAAALLVGKAFAGEMGTLSRYGISLDEIKKKGGDFNAVLEVLNARFEGTAKVVAGTVTGKMEQLANTWGDVKEQIGETIVKSGAFDNLLAALKSGMKSIVDLIKSDPNIFSDIFQVGVDVIKQLLGAIPSLLKMGSSLIKMFGSLVPILSVIVSAVKVLGAVLVPVFKILGPILGIIAKIIEYTSPLSLMGKLFFGGEVDRAESIKKETIAGAFEKAEKVTPQLELTQQNTYNVDFKVEGPDIKEAGRQMIGELDNKTKANFDKIRHNDTVTSNRMRYARTS